LESTSPAVGGSKPGKIKPKPKDKGSNGLAHPSELGALNAAHASANALENASPNSRVGRIAAYRDAVLQGRDLAIRLEEKAALLGALDAPDRPLSEIDTAVADADADVKAKADAVTALEAELAAAGGQDLTILDKLNTARDLLTEAETVAQDLKTEQAAALAYEVLDAEVKALTRQVADQPMLERSTLEAAANKPVTDAVEAAVRALLGL
jgi:hypothetical protein